MIHLILVATTLGLFPLCHLPLVLAECFGRLDSSSQDKWSNYEVSMATAQMFCDEGHRTNWATSQDSAISHRYHDNTVDQMVLTMEFRAGSHPFREYCVAGFKAIIENCDNILHENPLNWKRGGRTLNHRQGKGDDVFEANFSIMPETKRYTPGCCYLDIVENELWHAKDKYSHTVEGDIWDGGGHKKTWFGRIDSDDGKPAIISGLYVPMEITAEMRGDYVQFTLGGERWKSSEENVHSRSCEKHRCEVSAWDWIIPWRTIKCWFDC